MKLLSGSDIDVELKWSEFQSGSYWFKIRDELSIQNGILMREIEKKFRIVVPKQSISVVLNFLHDAPLAGHRDMNEHMTQ